MKDPFCLGIAASFFLLHIMRAIGSLPRVQATLRRILRTKASHSQTQAHRSWPPKHLVVTNDDGPDSPFFQAWLATLEREGAAPFTVVVPATNFSFVAKSLSAGPIRVVRSSINRYAVSGSPSTCINLALHQLEGTRDLPKDEILILSGPNIGHNCGLASILSSGTVGAAVEGTLLGVKSIALSFPFFNGYNNWPEGEIQDACRVTLDLVRGIWKEWPAEGETVFNVNVPMGAASSTEVRRTVVETRPSSRYSSLYAPESPAASDGGPRHVKPAAAAWESSADPTTKPLDIESPPAPSPGGETEEMYVWKPLGVRAFDGAELTPGSDAAAVKDRVISVTQLSLREMGLAGALAGSATVTAPMVSASGAAPPAKSD